MRRFDDMTAIVTAGGSAESLRVDVANQGDVESIVHGTATEHGHIDYLFNNASLAGLIPGGLTSIYSASKHAVVGFSLTLRAEARQYGIRVSTLCPGYMRTNIQKTAENVSAYMNSEKNRKMNANMKFPTPEDCIDQIIRGVRRNRGIIVTPLRHKIYWWIHRLAPEFIPDMFQRIIRMMKKQGDSP